jgi:hypothetical protein
MVQCHGGIPTCSAKMAGLMTFRPSCYVERCIMTCQLLDPYPQQYRCDNLIPRKSINFIGIAVSNLVKFPELQKLEALNI